MSSRPLDRRSCIPCEYGEHELCRHREDGRRYDSRDDAEKAPCRCETEGHPDDGLCHHAVSSDWGLRTCTNPAKKTVQARGRLDQEARERHWCGVHVSAVTRARERAEAADRKYEARRARDDRDREAARAADEILERLAPRLDALGIRSDTITRQTLTGRTGLLAPAETLEALVVMAEELQEIQNYR